MRHDISAHLLGIPDLPEEAFRHYGDRRIKPQGLGRLVKWATGGAIDVTGVDLSKPVVDVVEWAGGEIKQAGDWVGDELRQAGNWIDDQVKKHVPGGWATVFAVGAFAYGYFGGFEGLGGASGAAAGEAAAVTSGSGAAGVSTAGASTAASSAGGYAFTGGTSGVGGSMLGVEALSLPAAETSLYSLSGAAPSSVGGVTATAGEGMALAAPSSSALSSSAASGAGGMGAAQGVQMGSLPGMSTMGGAQGLTTAAAGGAGTVSALGTFSTAGEVGQYGIPKVSLTDGLAAKTTKDYLSPDEKQKEEEEKAAKEKEQLDLTAAFGALGAMLASRDASTRGNRSFADGGAVVPDKPVATQAATQQTAVTSGMTAAAQQAGAAETIAAGKDVVATEVTAPAAVAEEKITADKAQEKVAESLTGIKAEQGVLSKEAQAAAATVVPTETAVGKEAAAQGTATLVKDVADRTLQAGELVSGAAVDQKQVEAALAKTQAAQGVVSEEMTTQGQLNKLLTNFDAGNPPPWAAASMRGVTAQLAARGLGASSMAGQALVQATLESAMPIAAADAKVFEQMGLQNLSNRQQTAMVLAEQRAKFLGQEFDQNFQTKVLNAARIADIADKNFTADVTIALENARLTNTMDLQNLSNRQALILAKTAQVAALETANLNNRQQVAVENAKSFLAMDIRNLDNRQQTTLFKAKEIADSIISDTAAANAAKATNAANALEADKINAQLALSASQYNAAEKNKVAMFNRSAGDELLKFNAQEKNDRAEFNANMATQINIANAKVLADISTANTREVNAMAAVNAKNATDLSASTYAQLSQTYRDKLEQAWKTTDNDLMRANEISKTTLMANATKYDADAKADAAFYASMGQLAVALLTTGGSSSVTSTATTWISDWLKGKK
jgi:hypothetical protein